MVFSLHVTQEESTHMAWETVWPGKQYGLGNSMA